MNGNDALNAVKVLMDYCEDFSACKDCIFCTNPQAEYSERDCFFHNGYAPTFWEKFLERKRGLRNGKV